MKSYFLIQDSDIAEQTADIDSYLFFFQAHCWEKYYISNPTIICKQHNESINTNSYAARRRHTNFHRTDKFIIYWLCFFITSFSKFCLSLQSFSLINWIIKLCKRVSKLRAAYKKLKPFNNIFTSISLLFLLKEIQTQGNQLQMLDQ